jgi:tetratricopeptide (TPR) repeat protein
MDWHVVYKNIFCVMIISGLLLLAMPVSAQPQLLTATGEYVMGDADTIAQAKERARLTAMREVSEQAGVYLESTTVVKDLEISSDEIHAIAGSILQVKDTVYHEETADGSITVKAVVTALVDPLDVSTLQNRLQEKKAQEDYQVLLMDYQKTQAKYQDLQAEVKKLRGQLSDTAMQPAARQAVNNALQERLGDMDALNWLAEGKRLFYQHDYYQAAEAFGEVLKLDPHNAAAYRGRGMAYHALGIVQPAAAGPAGPAGTIHTALSDLNQAIELSPADSKNYLARGRFYESQREYRLAEQDYSQAIVLQPEADAYLARAELSRRRQDAAAAVPDYQAALAADNSTADAWYGLGWCYEELGRAEQAASCYRSYLQYADKKSYDYRLLSAKKRIAAISKTGNQSEG